MINNKYIFVFAIVVFILLSITGAGIFLNDEWLVGQQLNQLSQHHQVLYNEGKYGYFMNGTPSEYIVARDNILIYSMALPLISLPAMILFTTLGELTRLFIIALWYILGIYCILQINNKRLQLIASILLAAVTIVSNVFLYTPFPMSGENIPYEIIPIVMTNIVLMGIFSVISFKISETLFPEDKIKQIVGWIISLSCTSLLFWAGTLKDHVLLATIILLICYLQLQYMKNKNREYQIYALLLAGFSAWIRPEVGLFVSITIILFNIYSMRTILIDLVSNSFWVFIGSIPLFLNNYLLTGSPLKNPFLMARNTGLQANITNGNMIDVITTSPKQIPFAQLTESGIDQWAKLFFAPESGAIGLVVMLSIFIFSVLTLIKYRQRISSESKLLLALGLSSVIYYLLLSGAYLGRDGGIIPDIRYFTPAYALLSFFAISIIPYELNYRKILKNIFIFTPIVLIVFLFIISGYTPIGETYKTFRILPEILSVAVLGIMSMFLINHRKLQAPLLERLIPIAISSALSWQMIMIFIYHTSKAHYYPMFIPAVEFLYKIIFGG